MSLENKSTCGYHIFCQSKQNTNQKLILRYLSALTFFTSTAQKEHLQSKGQSWVMPLPTRPQPAREEEEEGELRRTAGSRVPEPSPPAAREEEGVGEPCRAAGGRTLEPSPPPAREE